MKQINKKLYKSLITDHDILFRLCICFFSLVYIMTHISAEYYFVLLFDLSVIKSK
jgi:hypothetical protein